MTTVLCLDDEHIDVILRALILYKKCQQEQPCETEMEYKRKEIKCNFIDNLIYHIKDKQNRVKQLIDLVNNNS